MNTYWTKIESGMTRQQIRDEIGLNLVELGKNGGFYTATEFYQYINEKTNKYARLFKTCFDKDYVVKKVQDIIDEDPTRTNTEIVEELNIREIFTKTGKPWTVTTFSICMAGIIFSRPEGISRSPVRDKHHALWEIFDAHRELFVSYNHAIKWLNANGYKHSSGRPWTRQNLSLIIHKHSYLDWSLPNRKVSLENQILDKLADEDIDSLIESDKDVDEIIEDLGVPNTPTAKLVLGSVGIGSRGKETAKRLKVNEVITDILTKNPSISYYDLWELLETKGLVNVVSKKSQRMYHYLCKENLIHLKLGHSSPTRKSRNGKEKKPK